ncbi:hypothetical protein L218DRAFT_958906 [Marasmius fiardii PR-910]|nr:hypothetical protein L218DRAFT_958906 [Marasmius fiardii PR-910]
MYHQPRTLLLRLPHPFHIQTCNPRRLNNPDFQSDHSGAPRNATIVSNPLNHGNWFEGFLSESLTS